MTWNAPSPAVDRDPEAERARLRELVRRGYDAISATYRCDDGSSDAGAVETTAAYEGWVGELSDLLPHHSRVLDLGCGAGIPASRELAARGFSVTGVDFSQVQVERAQTLVPTGMFIRADMTAWQPTPASFDAVISLYALIHVPLEDQQALVPRIRDWLVDGGYLLAIVGAERWTGIEPYLGADMFWDHADTATYLDWFREAHLEPQWHRFIPEGGGGHTLILARAR